MSEISDPIILSSSDEESPPKKVSFDFSLSYSYF